MSDLDPYGRDDHHGDPSDPGPEPEPPPTEVPDFIARAIAAQGKTTPEEVRAALEEGDPVPPDSAFVPPSADWREELPDPKPEPEPEQLPLDAEPVRDVPHARTTDPDTSQRSAAQTEAEEGATSTMRPDTKKHVSLALIAAAEQTARDVGRTMGDVEIHKRVSDLKNAGLIEAVREEHDPETNRDAIVWAATDLGRRVLSRLDAGETVKL